MCCTRMERYESGGWRVDANECSPGCSGIWMTNPGCGCQDLHNFSFCARVWNAVLDAWLFWFGRRLGMYSNVNSCYVLYSDGLEQAGASSWRRSGNADCKGIDVHIRRLISSTFIHQTSSYSPFYRPNCFFSKNLRIKNDKAENTNASSNPISPPNAGNPIFLPIGPMNHTCAMPITAPKTPKQKARTAAPPGGRSLGEFQMLMSYLRALKTKCSVKEMPS